MTTISKTRPLVKSAEKVSSGDVENILMSTPVNLISLNKTGNRKRGRPKKTATATSERPEKRKKEKIELWIRKRMKMSKRVKILEV